MKKVILILLLLVVSCGKLDELKNPLDGFKVILNYDIFDTFISLRFLDTATGELIGEDDITASIQGAHKNGIVDQLGNQKDEHLSVYGLLSLALNPKDPYIPSEDNPIQFSIVSIAESYQEQQTDITITETGIHYIDIYMEKSYALTRGYKKYTRDIRLINSALVDSFNLRSSDGEFEINIAKDVLLLDENHNPVPDTIATAELIVYTNVNSAPTPRNLVTEVEIDGNVEKVAFNPINIISLKITTASKDIHYTSNGMIEGRFGIDSDFINLLTNSELSAGEVLPIFNYSNHWIKETENPIQEIGENLYLDFDTNHLSLFGVAIVQSVCDFSGNIIFNLANEFPSEPIGASLYCYRKSDNKYIGTTKYELTSQKLYHDFNFLVPVENPIELRIRQRSIANGFTATPSNILVEQSCSQNNSYDVSLSSTSINFKGQVSFHFTEEFPNDNFNVRIKFYDADNDSYLLSKTYNISQDKTINIDTGVPNVQHMYLTFSAANQENAFTSNPERVYIEDVSAQNQSWNVSLTPINCTYNGNFNINYTDTFNSGSLEFNLLFINKQTKSVFKEKIISFNSSVYDVPFSVILPKNEQYFVRIMRTQNGQKFHAYPYEFSINNTCQNGLDWNIDLSPVEEIMASFNVTVECPSAEILPTLQGFYRTVWEENWYNAEIVNGYIELLLEMNGTYEVGLIIDGEMKIEEYHVTDTVNNIIYELDNDECSQMGW